MPRHFYVWACKMGVITVKSGAFLFHLPPDEARELGRALQDAAASLDGSETAAALPPLTLARLPKA